MIERARAELPEETVFADPARRVGLARGSARVESAMDLPAFEYEVLKTEHDAATGAGRAAIAGALMETVRAAVNPVLQHEYLTRCAELTGVPEETLRAELRRSGKGRSKSSEPYMSK